MYIGKTTTSFKTRFNSHKSNLSTSDTYLYRTLRVAKSLGATIKLVPLIVVENLKIDNIIKIMITHKLDEEILNYRKDTENYG